MTLIRWVDPFSELSAMKERMDRLFEETLDRPGVPAQEAGLWTPAVDIYETGEEIVVKAELPGVEKDQIDVEARDGVLTLRGERKVERDVKEENYHRVERSYGAFRRSFSLPSSVDPDGIRATLRDGILEVRLAKRAEVRPKKVPVKVS